MTTGTPSVDVRKTLQLTRDRKTHSGLTMFVTDGYRRSSCEGVMMNLRLGQEMILFLEKFGRNHMRLRLR